MTNKRPDRAEVRRAAAAARRAEFEKLTPRQIIERLRAKGVPEEKLRPYVQFMNKGLGDIPLARAREKADAKARRSADRRRQARRSAVHLVYFPEHD